MNYTYVREELVLTFGVDGIFFFEWGYNSPKPHGLRRLTLFGYTQLFTYVGYS